jgi:serine/threonine protein kinase
MAGKIGFLSILVLLDVAPQRPGDGKHMAGFSIGTFTVLGTLGKGANSTLLHVRRSADSKNYALKVVPIKDSEDLKFLEQARHEYRVAQMFNHPNLIKIYALETQRNWFFKIVKAHLLIEYVNGKTLDTFPRPLPVPKLVQVFEKVAAGLVHMHRRNVCHADLKPNNIMLARSGEVKIIDYGLARIKGELTDRIQGTPEYMAPEQVTRKIVNERTDIYNFGATMYRLLTWRLPPNMLAQQESGVPLDAKTWDKLIKPVRDFNAGAPPALCDLVQRCLSFNAAKRPERASELQGALDHLVEELVQEPEDRLEMLEW